MIKVHTEPMVEKLLKHFKMDNCEAVYLPLPSELDLSEDWFSGEQGAIWAVRLVISTASKHGSSRYSFRSKPPLTFDVEGEVKMLYRHNFTAIGARGTLGKVNYWQFNHVCRMLHWLEIETTECCRSIIKRRQIFGSSQLHFWFSVGAKICKDYLEGFDKIRVWHSVRYSDWRRQPGKHN